MPDGTVRYYRVDTLHGDYAAVKTYLQDKLTEKFPSSTATETDAATANQTIIKSYLTDAEVAASSVSLTPSAAGAIKEQYDFDAHPGAFDMGNLLEDGPETLPGIRDRTNPAELIRLRKESTLGSNKGIFYITLDEDGRGSNDGSDYLNARGINNLYGGGQAGNDDLTTHDVLIIDGGATNIGTRIWDKTISDKENKGAANFYIAAGGNAAGYNDQFHVTKHPASAAVCFGWTQFVNGTVTWVNSAGDQWDFNVGIGGGAGDMAFKVTAASGKLTAFMGPAAEDDLKFYQQVDDQSELDATPNSFWKDGNVFKVNDPDGTPEELYFAFNGLKFSYSTDAFSDPGLPDRRAVRYHAYHGISGNMAFPGSNGYVRGEIAQYGCSMIFNPIVIGSGNAAARVSSDASVNETTGSMALNNSGLWIDGCYISRCANGIYPVGGYASTEKESIYRGCLIAGVGDDAPFNGVVYADGDSHSITQQGANGLMVLFNRTARCGQPLNVYGFAQGVTKQAPPHGTDLQQYGGDTLYRADPQAVEIMQICRRVRFLGNVADTPVLPNTVVNNSWGLALVQDNARQCFAGYRNNDDVLVRGNVVSGFDDVGLRITWGQFDAPNNQDSVPKFERNLVRVAGTAGKGMQTTANSSPVFPNIGTQGATGVVRAFANTFVTTLSTQFFIDDATSTNDTLRHYDLNVYKGPGKWKAEGSDETTFAGWQGTVTTNKTYDPNGKQIT